MATITIQDHGIGIPPGELPQVFSRFHRAGNAADIPGSRLGLAIVQAAVENHGGTITLQSSPEGTEATVHFPISFL